jgi:ribosome biogenesis GTPase / thiamine phosphate phosphatase
MQATVYKSTGSWYVLKTSNGFLQARIKGKFKIKTTGNTNPIAVGDWVEVETETDDNSYVITKIEPRKNYINRTSPHNKKQQHIIASNINQTLLFATLKNPKTSLGFIDRFLITAETQHVPAIIVFNKADLYDEETMQEYAAVKSIYEKIGYQVVLISVEQKQGLDELNKILQNKTTLLSGHSGVGKSSFINHLFPDLDLKTLEVSEWSGKGLHSTTFAEMFDLPNGGAIIDTPGIRELGLVDMDKTELSQYFPEMRNALNNCKFNNCIHENEPGCAVKQLVQTGEISEDRYISYLTIKDSLAENNY